MTYRQAFNTVHFDSPEPTGAGAAWLQPVRLSIRLMWLALLLAQTAHLLLQQQIGLVPNRQPSLAAAMSPYAQQPQQQHCLDHPHHLDSLSLHY